MELVPGTYRIGAFRSSDPAAPNDGFAPYTWYGGGYVIGLGADVVVTGSVSGVDIAVLPSVKVVGRVVGRDGVGVPNAEVMLTQTVGGVQFPFDGAKTDSAGRFALRHVAMTVTLSTQSNGRTGPAWTSVDLDLRGDRSDLELVVDRGNIVTGVLRDTAGRPLANTDFGVHEIVQPQNYSCIACHTRSDAAGRFVLTLPNATLRFRNWPSTPTIAELYSKEYVIRGDATMEVVLGPR
ncbi:MAG TPA: hypothetical protein VJP45_11475, partial [Candidatus Limnocylindria bacterium]|nr:hypothetical protein [Candidatus Limnocylindria bacterium]